MSAVLTNLVVLIGPTAVGKSTVGSKLARMLEVPFLDSDELIQRQFGQIREIFLSHGESHFRELEARAIAGLFESVGDGPAVISFGGGAVLDPHTQALVAQAKVIFLSADLDTVRARLLQDSHRPLLAGNAIHRWEDMLKVRRPIYQKLADITIDVGDASPESLAQQLLALLTDATDRSERIP